jgi:hypothetical protein
VPGLAPVRVEFQLLVMFVDSAKLSVTVQPVSAVVPLLVTDTSIWYEVAWLLVTVAAQLTPPLVLEELLELELLLEDELLEEELEELLELLDEELELLLDELEELLLELLRPKKRIASAALTGRL